MHGNFVVLVGGAFAAVLAAASLVRLAIQVLKRRITLLGFLGSLAILEGTAGWLIMWFTQEPIWSAVPPNCKTFASIELKGHVYRTCSYLVHRYQAGEWMFWAGLLVFATCIGIRKLTNDQT
jgi:hypothetical protein